MKKINYIFQYTAVLFVSIIFMACSSEKGGYLEVVPNSLYEFSFDQPETVELSQRMKDFLEQVAIVMQEHKEYYFIINGHSDNTADVATNFKRAISRANNAAEYLKSKGIPSDRLKINNKGATEPITNRTDEKSLALNRRIQFQLIK